MSDGKCLTKEELKTFKQKLQHEINETFRKSAFGESEFVEEQLESLNAMFKDKYEEF